MADGFFKKTGNFLKKGSQLISDKINLDITHLMEGVKKNDIELVARCIAAGIDPNDQDGIDRRALPMAVDNTNIKIVSILLQGKASPNLPGKDGETAIFKAASWDNSKMVELLLNYGGDIYLKNSNGVSALEEAQRKGYTGMVNLMQGFKEGQKAEQVAEDTATHQEMKAKAEEAKKLREQKTAAAQKQDALKAEREQQKKVAAIQKKYNAEKVGHTNALLAAINKEDMDAIELFIQKLEDPDAVGSNHKTTPLLAAISNKNSKAVMLLIEKGADTLQVVKEQHHSALTLAVSLNAHKLVEFILDKNEKADAEILNNPSQPISPTFLAYKDAKMLNLLLAAGADPYFGGEHGRSPVVKAIEKASVAILPVLAKHKVDLNKATEGKTPLEWAIYFNRKDWVIGLTEEGVKQSPEVTNGQTPQELAAQMEGRDDIAALLDNASEEEE